MFLDRVGAKSLIGSAALGALLFAACSSTVDDTSTAEPSNGGVEQSAPGDGADETTTSEASAGLGAQVSFANDIQPILEQNCVSCHSGTGPGTTHLVMDTVEEIANIAEFAAFRVEQGEMPPWPLSGLQEVSFQYDLSMSDEDRQTIIDWAAEGGSSTSTRRLH